MTYRVGRHWGVTIVREGAPEDACHVPGGCFSCRTGRTGGEPHDQLVAVITNGDTALAERICALLNRAEAGPRPVGVRLVGTSPIDHDDLTRECDEETLSWDHFTPEQMDRYWIRCTFMGPHDEHKDEITGLTWRTEARPDRIPLADSCTCTVAGPDPACVVHQGRRARGPKPPNPPGCICDGSGRTCPRHGAVI